MKNIKLILIAIVLIILVGPLSGSYIETVQADENDRGDGEPIFLGGSFEEFYMVHEDPPVDMSTFDQVSPSAVPIPEPATMAMLSFGGLMLLRRRRRA